ncbi:uroporphyrinogen decarboxylase [Novispirillum itersonii]|uniref:Uroporphyrinogen decarboxylase n=1 Tax=Novispirillum itersonii TaxID=189 RepID=A0A7W9ZDZ1_NOVIT|nr:uroporphyrinogen decarboxylase [Novispirillum itersonii]MBB6209753.1 uroporphyrinogen decarboxylase [Novispirillum itersonii]
MSRPATDSKRFIRALKGETLTPPPFWLMRQAGRYLPEYRATRTDAGGFLDLCYNPPLAVEVTLQPLRRYGMDAAILFSDILVVPDAIGQPVSFKVGEGPCLTPLADDAAVDALDPSRLKDHLKPVFETVSGLAGAIPETTALIGFCGAPWTVATYMVEGGGSKDYARTKEWAYGHPQRFQRLIDTLVEASAEYLCLQIEHGAEAVQIFDSWAGVLPEEEFRRWVIDPIRRITERVKDRYPGVPVIGFPRQAGLMYLPFARETGVDAVSLDTMIPLDWAAETLQPLLTVQGNLDPIALLVGGDHLDHAVDHILKTLGKGPFVFNLGHGIVPPTPPENVARLADRIRGWKG